MKKMIDLFRNSKLEKCFCSQVNDVERNIICDSEIHKYSDLYVDVCALATKFKHIKSIAMIGQNSYEWIVVYFMSMLTGKILHVLEPGLDKGYYKRMLKSIEPDVLVNFDELLEDINYIQISNKDVLKLSEYHEEIEYREGKIVMFTTGTTGQSKGVELKFEQVLILAESLQRVISYDEKDRILLFSPFCKAMGHTMLAWGVLYGGSCVVARDQLEMINAMTKYLPTIVNFPPIYLGILKKSNKYIECMKKCKAVIVGSASMAREVWDFYQENGIKIYNGYGMTECVSAIAISDYNKEGDPRFVYPLDCCEIKLSKNSEIYVRGKTVSHRYMDGTDITDSLGWYHTGDKGRFHNEQLEILGRVDGVIALKNGIKLDLSDIKKRVLTDEYVKDCNLFVKSKYNTENLHIDVVLNENCSLSEEGLLNRINENLEEFERIKELNIREKF